MKPLQWISLFLVLIVVSELFLSEEVDAWGRRRRRGGRRRRRGWFRRVVRKAKNFVHKHGRTLWNVYQAWRQSRAEAQTRRNDGRYKRSLNFPPVKVGSGYLADDAANLKQMMCSWKRFRTGSCASKLLTTSERRPAHAHTVVTLSFADRLLSTLSMPGSSSHQTLMSTDCCESSLVSCSGSGANLTNSQAHPSPRSHPLLRPCRLRVDPEAKDLTADQCRLLDTEGLDRVERMLSLVLADLKHEELGQFSEEKPDEYVRISM